MPTTADTIDPSATQPMRPNPPPPPAGRRVTCPVLWVHLHGYAEAGVHDQVKLRESLHAAAANALAPVPAADRIVLETDTGMAVCFLGAAALAAASARALLEASAATPDLQPAVGLSIGPVAVLDDGDTAPRLIGDGVVVAERITAFAAPGQVVVTREFADAVAPVKSVGARLFAPFGMRTDAQLRSHDLLLLRTEGADVLRRLAVKASPSGGAGMHRHRWAAGAALAAVAVLVAVLAGGHRPSAPVPRQAPLAAAVAAKPAEMPVAAPTPPPAPPAVEAPPAPAATALVPVPVPSVREKREATLSSKATSAKSRQEARTKDSPKPTQAKPAATAAPAPKSIIGLAVSPWGEVLINGRRAGVSPPLTMVEVDSGRVTIEVRNGDSSPFTQILDLAPGEEVRIKHRF